jgi:hypothetical protein
MYIIFLVERLNKTKSKREHIIDSTVKRRIKIEKRGNNKAQPTK